MTTHLQDLKNVLWMAEFEPASYPCSFRTFGVSKAHALRLMYKLLEHSLTLYGPLRFGFEPMDVNYTRIRAGSAFLDYEDYGEVIRDAG